MPKPSATVSPTVQALRMEAERQGVTAYAIAKAQGLRGSTVHRALSGDVTPSIAVVESIATALGATIAVKMQKKRPSPK